MLKQLNIRNYAIIAALDVAFSPGLTVFTGETGAGKSILVEALGLILGDRADTTIIPEGSERTEITAIFDIEKNRAVFDILAEQALETEDNEIFLRRVINLDGRSRAFVNNSPVTAQLLRKIGDHLVDIHGQHAHQSLTRQAAQRDLLDEFGSCERELAAVAAACNTWQKTTARLADIIQSDNKDAALALLRYQVQELEALHPEVDEYAGLDEEFRRLANTSQLLESVQRAISLLHAEDQSVYAQINSTLIELQGLEQFDESLKAINLMLNEASIQVSEACDELRNYMDRLETDPGHLQEIEQRLSDLHTMARKHRINPQQLAHHLQELQQQLSDLENTRQTIDELQTQQSQAQEKYQQASAILHQGRLKAAGKMAAQISSTMRKLGMPHGQFEISVEMDPNRTPRMSGCDQIEFLVNTNPGQALQSLRKVASGGELSRISLAIQVIGSSDKGIPCLIFDEVDAGIGGGIAEIVGKLLHGLAANHQVLCVTHLPQVASQGDHHFQVNKTANKSSTKTWILDLNPDDRVDEIARMLGGLKITRQSREVAREMLGEG